MKTTEPATIFLKVNGHSAKYWKCPHVSVDQIISAADRDDSTGICVLCGSEQGCCEPDARNYKCESCGGNGVYGAEELLFRTTNL